MCSCCKNGCYTKSDDDECRCMDIQFKNEDIDNENTDNK